MSETFGPDGAPGVQVILPRIWSDEPTRACGAALTADDGLVSQSVWYLWWLRAKTLNAMCVRRGLSGQYIVTSKSLGRNICLLFGQRLILQLGRI